MTHWPLRSLPIRPLPVRALPMLALVFLAGAVSAVDSVRAQGVVTPLPLVESFDGGVGGVPLGWSQASSGELDVTLAAETRGMKEGAGCWRISVPSWSAGAARVRRTGLSLKAGEPYTVEVWMRSQELSAPVEVTLSSAGSEGAVLLGKRFFVGPQWRRCVLQGSPTRDEANASLTLAFEGSGVLWLDALRVREGAAPLEPDPPVAGIARKGNLLFNSSFTLATDGWTLPEQLTPVKDRSPDGDRFGRWQPGRFPLQARPFRARPQQAYTISAFLRSQRTGAQVELSLTEVGGSFRATKSFPITSEWTRYSFTSTLPCDESDRYCLSITPAADAHGIDLDAVQVEEGALTDYAPAASVEVSSGLRRSDLFPLPNEMMGIPAQVAARGALPEGVQIRYRLEGFYGETVGIGTVPVPAGPSPAEVPIRLRIPQLGTLRLLLDAVVDGQIVSQSEAILTALPPAPTQPNPNSFFGAHGTVGTRGEWHAPTVGARAGVRWWRLHELGAYTAWAVAEPASGTFRWFDAEVDALRSRQLSLLGVLTRTPEWAGRDPGGLPSEPRAWPPARISDLGDYVRQVVGHYRGRIAAYELWNEPWSRLHWAAGPERYAELAKGASVAARQTDPAAVMVGGSFYAPQREFADRVLARGFLDAIDRVSMHHYTEPEAVTYGFGGRDQVTQYAQSIRGKVGLVAQGGTKAANLWNTETGTPNPTFQSWLNTHEASRAAARTVAKTLILNKAIGVQRLFYQNVWHESGPGRLFENALSDNTSMLDYDGSGKPVLAAYAACARILEGAGPAGRVETAALKAYVFQRRGETVVAAWSPPAFSEGRELLFRAEATQVSAVNLMGNPRGAWAVAPPAPVLATTTDAARKPVPLAKDHTALVVRNEPIYITFRGMAPAAVLQSLKKARLRTPGTRSSAG